MIMGIVELRKMLRSISGRAGRAAGILRGMSKISTVKPSIRTAEALGRNCQIAFDHLKAIVDILDRIVS